MSTLARCHSACAGGIRGRPVEVEIHRRGGESRLDIVGLPDTAGRESRERVRSAITSSGYEFPDGRVLVNLAPAGTPKRGTGHDLAIAVGILTVTGVVSQDVARRALLFGEVALDGRLRAVRGAFLLAATAADRGLEQIVAPVGNAHEAALATDVPVVGATSLIEAVLHLAGVRLLPPVTPPARDDLAGPGNGRDFAEVRGQPALKTALGVAAAGGHNILLSGPPGCGKTLVAERFPDLLPPLTRDEALEVAALRSAAGLSVDGLPVRRPFRAPSCGASAPGILGGGNPPSPGEISLAHRGVLFLDELPQFRGEILEGLRGPLEDGRITIARAGRRLTVPARFQLLAAMNPCPCGHGSGDQCQCTPLAKERYRRRISGPVLDRIDLRIHVTPVKYDDLRSTRRAESTAAMREVVERARAIQARRLGPVRLNASLSPREIECHCRLDAAGEADLEAAVASGRLTARGVGRVLRVARTVADTQGHEAETLTTAHLRTALRWRVDAGQDRGR